MKNKKTYQKRRRLNFFKQEQQKRLREVIWNVRGKE